MKLLLRIALAAALVHLAPAFAQAPKKAVQQLWPKRKKCGKSSFQVECNDSEKLLAVLWSDHRGRKVNYDSHRIEGSSEGYSGLLARRCRR